MAREMGNIWRNNSSTAVVAQQARKLLQRPYVLRASNKLVSTVHQYCVVPTRRSDRYEGATIRR